VARLPLAFRALGLALALPALLYQPQRPAPGDFELLAADVGQGSAVLVRTATASVLVDAGPAYAGGDAGQRVVVPLLSALAEAPTHVVLTHSDTDHVGGALAVLARHPQAAVWASFNPPDLATAWSDPAPLAAETQAARTGQRRWTRCEAGQHWVHDGVRFDVLHPTPDAYEKRTTTNNLSCVVWVRGAHASALLTGDLDAAHEAQLLARYPEGLPATVLMAPHHGSKHSSSAPFLVAVAPQWVLVQAGHRNRYGHPAPEALARYQAQGARWVATPECGALTWHSAQPAQVGCRREAVRRYWHWVPPHKAPAPAPDPDSPEPPTPG
jgi:competence protein ComEC